MTAPIGEFVWLVMDADRDVLDVCLSEESAEALAHRQSGTFERWPISRGPRDAAWAHAMRVAESVLSGSQRPTEPQTPTRTRERVSDTVNAADGPKIVLMSEPDRSTT